MPDSPRSRRSPALSSMVGAALALLLAFGPHDMARAQSDDADDAPEMSADLDDPTSASLGTAEANRLLALPLPADPAAAFALLAQQQAAALALGDRARQLELLYLLAPLAKGRPGGERLLITQSTVEFNYGSQGKATQLLEQYLADDSLGIETRAVMSQNLTVNYGMLGDRFRMERAWGRSQALLRAALEQPQAQKEVLRSSNLRARSEVERHRGDLQASAETLREAVLIAKVWMNERAAFNKPGAPDPQWQRADNLRQASLGLLTYALTRAGRFSEATTLAEQELRQSQDAKRDIGSVGRWHYRLAHALVQTRQYEAGLRQAQRAETLLAQAGTSGASNSAYLALRERVFALIALRRWAEADPAYEEFLRTMPPDAPAAARASDPRLRALLAAKAGRTDAALTMIESSVRSRTRTYGEAHPLTRESKGVRGAVQLIAGNPRRAMSDYEDLFGVLLDNPSGWLDLGPSGSRGYYINIVLDEYLRAAADTYRKTGALDPQIAERALQVADRAQLGLTHEALIDSTARLLAGTPALRDLLVQEQDQRKATRDAYRELAAAQALLPRDKEKLKEVSEDQRRDAAAKVKAARDAVDQQQARLNSQRDDIAKRYPAYADLVTPGMPTAAALKRLLSPGEAMLVVYPAELGTMVWVVTPDKPVAFQISARTEAEIAALVNQARAGLDLGTQPAGASTALPPALFDLYRELVAPLEPSLAGTHSLIVVGQGALASVPFAALLTAAPQAGTAPAYLVRRFAVTQLPTASALQALRRSAKRPAAAKAMAGFGDPLFNAGASVAPASKVRRLALGANARAMSSYDVESGFRYAEIPPLPETRAELTAIASTVGADPQRDLFFGAQASRKTVLATDLRDRRIVAFATHGIMPGELPGISKPALALAGTTEPGDSPLLVLDDVLSLQLNAQWVVLSACNTASGEAGGSAMSGLVRAFFFAGSRSVLATHWAVDSESAAALVSATFKANAVPSRSRAASLREAQLAMIDGTLGSTPGSRPGAWAHPFYWAPYALFGDPAR